MPARALRPQVLWPRGVAAQTGRNQMNAREGIATHPWMPLSELFKPW